MSFAKVNNIKLYYEEQGKGAPLVLISGFGADHAGWDAIFPTLAQHYRVIRFDNRGAGQSDAPDEAYDMEMMADDTAALLDHLQIEQAHVCGHSMGTSIALSFALKYPQKINKMILCNGYPKINVLSTMVFDVVDRLVDAETASSILNDLFIPWCYSNVTLSDLDNHPEVRARNEYFKTTKCPQTLTGFKGQLAALLSFDISNELQKINMPTLLIAGDKDILTPPEDSQFLAERIPSAQLHIVHDTGHTSFAEKPQESAEVIHNFLQL
jgi:proline-specific peptidase